MTEVSNSTPLLFTVSGLRGIVGQSFFPSTVTEYASAFGTWCKSGRVVLARDTRASGEMLKMAVSSALLSAGCEVIDIGITPTPTVGLAVTDLKAKGGITVTASHNPIQWNALKFFNHNGRYLSSAEIEAIRRLVEKKNFKYKDSSGLGSIRVDNSQIKKHIAKILKLKLVLVEKIKRTGLKVAIDACNGAGFQAAPELLRALGCRIVEVSCDNTGTFPRGPEPVAKNLKELENKVKKTRADIGFALDPDADRLAIISEMGRAIGEEYTLALAVDYVLSRKPGKVVVNLSTSRMVEEIARRHGCRIEKTKVGEANVSLKLEQVKGLIGGEGNGGVILPELHYTRDGLLAMALILSYMAESGETITSLIAEIPKYYIVKQVLTVEGNWESKLGNLKSRFAGARATTLDGVRFDFTDSWLHLRQSNTEPVVRIIAEAKSRQAASALVRQALRTLKTS